MTSDSSASTTPMPLTPESTGNTGVNVEGLGSPELSSATGQLMKKARRQTAFYPNMNSTNKPLKPFSRSAAKRESVMALGSIEYLQHYFTKTGLAAKKNPLDKPHHGLVPAIGGLLHVPTSPPPPDPQELHLPPSPAIPAPPTRPAFTPHVKTHEVHPDSLLPGVINHLSALTHAWHIDSSSETDAPIEVLSLLKSTTRTVRSVRNYVLSLPDESTGSIRSQFRSKHFQFFLPSSVTDQPSQPSSSSSSRLDPLALIRRSALEVLTALRELEETSRLPLSDDAYDAQSDGRTSRGAGPDGNSRLTSPTNPTLDLPHDGSLSPTPPPDDPGHPLDADVSITFSLVQVQGRDESVPVWEEENDGFDDDEKEKERRELWDEKLEVGNGWLYQQDIKLSDLSKERGVIINYLNVVDEVLFNGSDGTEGSERRDASASASSTERGWERERRKLESRTNRTSTPRSRSKSRRVSTSDAEGRSFGLQLVHNTSNGAGKRRVSTGMLQLISGMRLTSEPEDMEGIREEEGDGEGDIGASEGEGLTEDDEQEESMDDEDLPEWAKRNMFIDNDLDRAYAFINSLLPHVIQPALIPPSTDFDSSSPPVSPSRTSFLTCLSSGQFLCIAYNACIRKSKEPWGFISKDGIHDIIALEKAATGSTTTGPDCANSGTGTGKTSWTFRRTDNLRLWTGALKLRYMLPIQIPSQIIPSAPPSMLKLPSTANSTPSGTPLSSPKAQQKFPSVITNNADRKSHGNATIRRERGGSPDSFVFDAKVVARKEEGWEDMLENVLLKWMWKAVEEQRRLR